MRVFATSAKRSRALLLAAGVFVLAVAVGFGGSFLFRRSSPEPQSFGIRMTSMTDWLRGVDAVVDVSGLHPTGQEFTILRERWQLLEGAVEEVVWLDPLAGPQVGARILIAASYVEDDRTMVDGTEGRPSDAYLFLHAADVEGYPEFAAEWSLGLVATEGPEGLTFPGPFAEISRYREGLTAAELFLSGQTPEEISAGATFTPTTNLDLQTLVAFVQENRGLGTDGGPVSRAFSAPERHQFDRELAWYAIPVDRRPLDPEFTPPSFLATLEEITILIEVPPQARIGGAKLVIRSPQGISHIADLSGGSHPAIIFVDAESTVDLVITNSSEAIEGPVIGSLTPEARANPGASLLVRVPQPAVSRALSEPSLPATTGNETAQITSLSMTELQVWLDAVAGEVPTPAPEPTL